MRWFVIVLFLIVTNGFSQQYQVIFTHDVAGNRIRRHIVQTLNILSTDSISHDSIIANRKNIIDDSLLIIQVGPNPTEKLITIRINNSKSSTGFQYAVYTIYGQMILYKKSSIDIATCSFMDFRSGSYILQIMVNGITRRVKIVKI